MAYAAIVVYAANSDQTIVRKEAITGFILISGGGGLSCRSLGL